MGDPLFSKLTDEQASSRVFDFQFGYFGDEGSSSSAFSIFQFRWEEGEQIFSVRTGSPLIEFSGDGDPDSGTDAKIDDHTKTRVFKISGGTVTVEELRKNRVLSSLECPNAGTYEVTVFPI